MAASKKDTASLKLLFEELIIVVPKYLAIETETSEFMFYIPFIEYNYFTFELTLSTSNLFSIYKLLPTVIFLMFL